MTKINNWLIEKYVGLKQRQEEAQGLAEYGLILALIAVVAVAALIVLGDEISSVLDEIGDAFGQGGGGEGGE